MKGSELIRRCTEMSLSLYDNESSNSSNYYSAEAMPTCRASLSNWKPSMWLYRRSPIYPAKFGGVKLPKHLQRMKNGSWRVRVVVPPPLVLSVGKTALTRPLGTRNEQEAISRAAPIIRAFEEQIAVAKQRSRMAEEMIPDLPFDITELPEFIGDDNEPIFCHPPTKADPPLSVISMVRVWSNARSSKIGKKTWNSVLGKMTRFAAYFGGCFYPDHICADDLRDYPDFLLSQGLKPKTVDEHLVYIKAVFEENKAAGLLSTNAAKNLRRTSLAPPSRQRMNDIKKHSAEVRKRLKTVSLKSSVDARNFVFDLISEIETDINRNNMNNQ